MRAGIGKLFHFLKSLFVRRRPMQRAPDKPLRRWDVRCLSKGGVHRMSCVEWGDPANPRVLVCVHGLTRNGRDFDDLAEALSKHYRVICPDIAGRGESDWLVDKLAYTIPQYATDILAMLHHLGIKEVDWVGTSMGGLIGMGLASQPNSPIRRMVLNDVGPVITGVSLQRIGEYVGRAPDFPSFEAAEEFVRKVSADFGNLSDVQWRHLTEYSIKQEGLVWKMRYDPGIGDAFRIAPLVDVAIWPIYDAIRCPTLVIRGAKSDLLLAETVQEMTQRGPRAEAVEIPDVGHAPALMDVVQIDIVRRFLLAE
ncbi:MAG: alpha/beta hydrolase [Rhodocyclales bacterium]|nr:alpha/beta hydrolase [Rhodocyclales bacterium]